MKKNRIALVVMTVAFLFLFAGCEEEIKSCTVGFETGLGGGISIPSVTVLKGESVKEPEEPSMEGMKFCGWYLDDTLYDFTLPVTSDITLLAKWEHVKHIFNESDVCSICNGVRCGEDVVFTYDKDTKTLFLNGRGSTNDYFKEGKLLDRPWDEYLQEVTKVVVGEGITKIGDATFVLIDESKGFISTSINEILLPTSLKEIGSYSFAGTSVKKIIIPDGTIKLGDCAFCCCSSLSEITIPSSIKEIGGELFDESYDLSKVTFLGAEEDWIKFDWDFDTFDYDVYCATEDKYLLFESCYDEDGLLTAQYLTKYGIEQEKLVVPNYYKRINKSIFQPIDGIESKSKAKSIYIPNSVEKIEYNTFSVAPKSLEEIHVDKTEVEFKNEFSGVITKGFIVIYKDAT